MAKSSSTKLTARDLPDGPNLFDDVPPPVAAAVVGWDKAEGPDKGVTLRLSDIFGWDDDECDDELGWDDYGYDAHPVTGELLEAPCTEANLEAIAKVMAGMTSEKPELLPRPMLQTVPPFSPFQGKEAMEWEKARMAFGHAVKAAGRNSEIVTYTGHGIPPGALDHRKLARLANTLLGRVASDKPEPKTEEWRKAAAALAGQGAAQ